MDDDPLCKHRPVTVHTTLEVFETDPRVPVDPELGALGT